MKDASIKSEKATDSPELSVVILCYRSGPAIISYVKKMEEELLEGGMADYELVLVCNYFPGSGDETPDIICRMAAQNPKIVPVTLEKKGMMGWDVRTGFKATKGKAVAFIDGDGQMPSIDIVRLHRVLKSGEFDLIKTFRKTRYDSAYRKFISGWYNLFFRLLFPGASFRDVNAKPKLMTREAYRKMELTSNDWFIDAEIMLESMRHDMNVAEVPTIFHKNEWRGSFVKIWTIFEFLYNLAKYRIKYWSR